MPEFLLSRHKAVAGKLPSGSSAERSEALHRIGSDAFKVSKSHTFGKYSPYFSLATDGWTYVPFPVRFRRGSLTENEIREHWGTHESSLETHTVPLLVTRKNDELTVQGIYLRHNPSKPESPVQYSRITHPAFQRLGDSLVRKHFALPVNTRPYQQLRKQFFKEKK